MLVILVGVAVLAVGSVLVRLQLIVVPVLIALLLASAIHPLVDILHRRGVPTLAAVWLSLLAGITAVGGVGWAVVHSITSQWSQISFNSDLGFDRIERRLAATALPFTEEELRQARESALESFFGGLSFSDAVVALSLLANAFTAVLLSIVVLFFFLKDGRNMWIFLTRPLNGRTLQRATYAGEQAIVTMGGYLRGTTTIALIDAMGIGLAMFFLGVPFALPLTMIIFLGGFVPVIGATITGIFAVLVAYITSGTGPAIALAIAVVIVQQTEGNLLQPLIMGKAVKLHPVVILLALGAGAILAGVIGAVLAVPACAVVWAAIKAWNEKPGQGSHPAEQPTER
ncbi:AI-2E family transporter [Arthrobacter sp. TMS2-4]